MIQPRYRAQRRFISSCRLCDQHAWSIFVSGQCHQCSNREQEIYLDMRNHMTLFCALMPGSKFFSEIQVLRFPTAVKVFTLLAVHLDVVHIHDSAIVQSEFISPQFSSPSHLRFDLCPSLTISVVLHHYHVFFSTALQVQLQYRSSVEAL
jgi:hypothetical protein